MNPHSSPLSDSELDALLAEARWARSDTARAEYGFESRLLARLRGLRPESAWGMLSWRMMPVFAAVALILVVWQERTLAEVHDADQVASLENIDTADGGDNLN
jgi:hypothetical protein